MVYIGLVSIVMVLVIAAVAIIISDNKTEVRKAEIKHNNKKNISDKTDTSCVYDGVPLYRCKRCGAHAVVVSFMNKAQKPIFYVRCKECGQGTETSPDLGFVMKNWNCGFGIKPKDIMGPPMKL